MLPKVKQKIYEWYHNKIKQHDPSLVSAENLVESLYARMNINKKLKPQEEWFQGAISPNELEELRNYNDNKEEFHQLVSLLRVGVSKVLLLKPNLSGGTEFTDYDYLAKVFKDPIVADTFEPSEQQALSERLWHDRNNSEQGDY